MLTKSAMQSLVIFSIRLILVGFFLLSTSKVFACPSVDGVPDYNCDGKVSVAVVGDSLVLGFGDTKNNNKGGYVLRSQKKLPNVNFDNLGVLGLRTKQLLLFLRNAFDKGKKDDWKAALDIADIVVLDLGRNDRWLFGEPIDTYRNLKKASAKIKSEVKKDTGYAPLVVIAVNMLPNRGSQGPWVKELDTIILKNSTQQNPSDLRFDLVSKRLLSSDQIHPTPKGYSAITDTFVRYITKTLSALVKILHQDLDDDGLPDSLESSKFGTDPALSDTDGDGKKDGDEVFLSLTNPLVID